MIKRILLGLGGTPYTDVAIERAVELAKDHGARITGVTVVDIKRLKKIGPLPPGGDALAEKLRKKHPRPVARVVKSDPQLPSSVSIRQLKNLQISAKNPEFRIKLSVKPAIPLKQ